MVPLRQSDSRRSLRALVLVAGAGGEALRNNGSQVSSGLALVSRERSQRDARAAAGVVRRRRGRALSSISRCRPGPPRSSPSYCGTARRSRPNSSGWRLGRCKSGSRRPALSLPVIRQVLLGNVAAVERIAVLAAAGNRSSGRCDSRGARQAEQHQAARTSQRRWVVFHL